MPILATSTAPAASASAAAATEIPEFTAEHALKFIHLTFLAMYFNAKKNAALPVPPYAEFVKSTSLILGNLTVYHYLLTTVEDLLSVTDQDVVEHTMRTLEISSGGTKPYNRATSTTHDILHTITSCYAANEVVGQVTKSHVDYMTSLYKTDRDTDLK